MTRSIFDPTGPDTERSGNRNLGPDAANGSRMPPGVTVEGRTFSELMADFTDQLRQIRAALEDRDFVTLSDILAYEATQTCRLWQEALAAVRGAVVAL